MLNVHLPGRPNQEYLSQAATETLSGAMMAVKSCEKRGEIRTVCIHGHGWIRTIFSSL